MFSKKQTFLFLFFSIVAMCLTGGVIFMQNYLVKNIDYAEGATLAVNNSCTVTGKTGSFNFSYNAYDQTSGVDYWQCHSINSNSWTTCPNSSKCTNYKINANSGYDQIRVLDVAGHASSTNYLYKKTDIQFVGYSNYSSSVTRTGGSKAKIIDSYYAYTGSINSVNIQSDETIKVTGTAKSCSEPTYTAAHRDNIYICGDGGGTYNPTTKLCEAESYRLQNDTCWCAMKLVNGKLEVAWPEAKGACLRKRTYCTDQFKKDDTVENRYNMATKSVQDSNTGTVCTGLNEGNWGSSCNFTRKDNTECFTQYNSVPQVMSSFSGTYSDYEKKIGDYTNRLDSAKSSIAGFATAGDTCAPSSSNSSNGYLSNRNMDSLCDSIGYNNVSTNYAIKSNFNGQTIYIYPVIASAPCNWVTKDPTKDPKILNPIYGKYSQNVDGDYFYYCDGIGEVITKDNRCKKEEVKYCYDYRVDYYYGG